MKYALPLNATGLVTARMVGFILLSHSMPRNKCAIRKRKSGPTKRGNLRMKLLSVFAATAVLIATSIESKAALGWTLNESVQHYGGPVKGPLPDKDGIGRSFYLFKVKRCSIGAFYINGKISRVVYDQKEALGNSNFGAFLFGNAPEVVWVPLMNSIREWLGCTGKLQIKCWAQLSATRTTLVVATIDDYRAVRAAGGS
jgi:hypothetical protein